LSQPASSVQADRDALGALAAFLGTGAAVSLGLFPVLIMRDSLGSEGFFGWGIVVILTAVVAFMTTKPVLHQARIAILVAGCLVIPAILIVIGNAAMGGILLGDGLLCAAFAMPLVEWACGLSEYNPTERKSVLSFSSGREAPNPIPSALILGVVIFAWPGDLLTAGWVAAPFFGFLLMLASLGGMFQRVRESSAGVVAVHPKFMTQWFVTGLIATALCVALGFLLPMAMGNQNGIADRKLGGPVNEGPLATHIRKSRQEQPKPNQDPSSQGLGDQEFQKDLPAPSQRTPQKMTQEELQNKVMTLVGLLLLAAILMWLLKKYNKQILAFLRWLWATIAGPFIRAWNKWKDNKRKKKHETAVRAILTQIEDPFADPPANMTNADLGPLYDKLVADLSLLGAKPKPDESALAFIRRVSTVYTVDKESLAYLGHVVTEATFSPRPIADNRLSTSRERFLKLRKQIHGSVAQQTLAEKQEAYRWSFAESKLTDDQRTPSA